MPWATEDGEEAYKFIWYNGTGSGAGFWSDVAAIISFGLENFFPL